MSQNDMVIANQTAPNFRADLNSALQALASTSSGSSAPATTYANMLWYDTSSNILKMRSEADDAWIEIGTLDQSGNTFAPSGLANLTQAQAEDDTSTVFGQVSGQRLAQAVAEFETAAVDLSLVFLARAVLSTDATADFTAFDATKYDAYMFTLSNVVPADDNRYLQIRTSTDGGVSYNEGLTDYEWLVSGVDSSRAGYSSGSDSSSSISLSDLIGSSTGEDGYSGTVTIYGPHLSTENTRVVSTGSFQKTNSRLATATAAGRTLANSNVNAVRFFMSSGSLESGTITMYGMSNS